MSDAPVSAPLVRRSIASWCASAYRLARDKGFEDGTVTAERIAIRIALIHSELSEALECVRDPLFGVDGTYLREVDGKPEGFRFELADVFLRLAHLAELCDIDLEEAVRVKHEFNRTRPRMHGKVL